MKTSNGSLMETDPGRSTASATASDDAIRPQFSSHAHSSAWADRIDSADDSSAASFKEWPATTAEADAGRGIRAIGDALIVALVALAVLMAGVAIHQEERLASHERQLLQRQR